MNAVQTELNVLDDATDDADDTTTVTFEAQTADHTVAGTIDNAVAADETVISVVDANNSAKPDTVTFSGNIGSTIPVDSIMEFTSVRFLIEAVWLQPENVAHSEIPELVNSGHGLHPLTQNN